MQFELWTDHNDRAARVINALTKQVLTETSALAFDHVGKRLQLPLVSARHRFTATPVIQQ